MGKFLIVSRIDKVLEYIEISKEYDVGFEINDFYEPDILDDEERLNEIIDRYLKLGLPKNSTMHGAFFDLAIFSKDKKIHDISCYRMKQCMEIAKKISVRAVVFHINYNCELSGDIYNSNFVASTSEFLKELLEEYPDINIYIENMFAKGPYIFKRIADVLKDYNNFGVCFDWAHAIVFGKSVPVEEWVEVLGEYIKHIHINDNDLNNDLHLPVGTGEIDWNEFAKYYDRCFKNCTVLIETNEPDGQIKSLEYLKKKLNF